MNRTVRFGPFRADFRTGELRKGGSHIRLQRLPFDVLRVLIERSGTTVTREEFRDLLWPGTVSEGYEVALSTAVRKIRSALCDSAEAPMYIETVPKRGYRFSGVVEEEEIPTAVIAEVPVFLERRSMRWPIYLAVPAITLAGLWMILRPLPPPRVLGYEKVTNDSAQKIPPLLTDGPRLYFNESSADGYFVAQVSVEGMPVPVSPLLKGFILMDIASNGAELLVQESTTDRIDRDTHFAIFSLPGGPMRRLAVNGHSGVWSSDGSRMAYAEGSTLYSAMHDGSRARKLTTVDGTVQDLRWAPDGKSLQFGLSSRANNLGYLWQIDPDGSRLRRVVPDISAGGAWMNSWFVFQGGKVSTQGEPSDLMAMRADSWRWHASGVIPLTSGPMELQSPVASRDRYGLFAIGHISKGELSRYDAGSGEFVPWMNGLSADGVVFSAGRRVGCLYVMARSDIMAEPRGWHRRRQLTFAPLNVFYPRWSPDGQTVAFSSGPVTGQRANWKIHSVSIHGGPVTDLTGDEIQATIPAWSPDGRSMAFGGAPWLKSWSEDSTSLNVLDIDSKKVSSLAGSAGLWAPKWSPDGRYIVAETADSEHLMILDRERGGGWHLLLKVDEVIGYVIWSHDGKYLYFNLSSEPVVYRIRMRDGHREEVARVKGFRQSESAGLWFGLSPDDMPLMLRDVGIHEIYRLDMAWR